MPTTNGSSLVTRINQIVASAAQEIAQAVRQNIADEVNRLVGAAGAVARGGRGGQRRAAGPAGGGRRRRRRGAVDNASLEKLLKFIGAKPGLRGEEIRKQVGLPDDVVRAGLAKLRETKKVRTKGERRATTYATA
jgi:hypothetical protein